MRGVVEDLDLPLNFSHKKSKNIILPNLRKEYRGMQKDLQFVSDNPPPPPPPPVPWLYPCLSCYCHCNCNLYHSKAKEQIKAGDVLILEKPYAAVLVSDNKTTHCSHCFELLEENSQLVYVFFII